MATPPSRAPKPAFTLEKPRTRVYVGDCRSLLPRIPEVAAGAVDLVFADPPFNWQVKYDKWHDGMGRDEYLRFTYDWLDACVDALAPHGAIWVNIPDDTAAEIVLHLKNERALEMVNWCVWHYRFGQNRMGSFIQSKVHALYFVKDAKNRVWNPTDILEPSDRATTYFDGRTHNKKTGVNGLRVPMDVWYGKYWGRIQGNNSERRAKHQNQLPEVYLERVIRACSDEGMLVMDPFLGSGTTGVVARELGRRFLGTEYSRANARSAFERIKAGAVRVKKDEPTTHVTAIFPPRTSAGARAASARTGTKPGVKSGVRSRAKSGPRTGPRPSSR